MKTLTIEAFLNSLDDIETAKYKILAIVKQYRKLFQQNKIYPYLAELIETGYILAQMFENKPEIPESIEDELIQINLYETQDQFNSIYLTVDEYNDFFTLIEWTLPFLEETVDEGKIIYDFVEDSLDIIENSNSGKSNESGYFLIPDNEYELVNVYYFELKETIEDKHQLHQLKTTHIDTISKTETLNSNFPELMQKYIFDSDFSTYYFNTELDFPFVETLLPIVKRKLTEKIVLV